MIALNVKYLTGPWKRILRYKLGNVICINKIARPLSTVNPKFVKLYSELKGDWWDENGPLHILHMYNPLRIQFVKDGLISAGFKIQDSNLPLKGAQILEVGCGGLVTEGLARLGAQVTGIDVSTNAIDIARKHIKLNISEYIGYIRKSELYSNNHRRFCSNGKRNIECVKTVKPGKSVFITSVNKTLASWLAVIVGYE
ncbi:ubiquinone biosynthesis O-methyltransferase-like [Solenopsis invicta]|uniref:ubiquinone biosynthesis O-methyltransferase-like n=1 Tax=Solenopsis invicta TaxID=13686 RepID=UPI00193CF6E1|nr:ubiquinone biosynthesis O-methyltransferase-like [Solenopsis invicta]